MESVLWGRLNHLDEKSAFRPCGRDLVEFFSSTGWAFYVQEAVPMRLPDAGRLDGSNPPGSRLLANLRLAVV